nr:fluoride efflux transporter CrcB [uncultured Brevundimonas sp.]
MNAIWNYAWVALGAGLGGALRHGANRLGLLAVGPHFPAGTLSVNLLGCLVMGVLTGWFAHRGEFTTPAVRLFLTTGLLGGFTTFSAFSLDTALMWEKGAMVMTIAYVGLSVLGSLAAVFIGLALARAVFS